MAFRRYSYEEQCDHLYEYFVKMFWCVRQKGIMILKIDNWSKVICDCIFLYGIIRFNWFDFHAFVTKIVSFTTFGMCISLIVP